jgi:hypothetical protein
MPTSLIAMYNSSHISIYVSHFILEIMILFVCVCDSQGISVLMHACIHGRLEIMKALMDHGADRNMQDQVPFALFISQLVCSVCDSFANSVLSGRIYRVDTRCVQEPTRFGRHTNVPSAAS